MSEAIRSFRRRLATVRGHVRSLSDALFVARLLAWRVTLAALKRTIPLARLTRLMANPSGRPMSDTRRVVEMVDWVYGPRRSADLGNCLDRSLVLYRFLSRSEPETRLVIGMRRGPSGVEGHAWVTAGDLALGTVTGPDGDFVPLAAFDSDGCRVVTR